MKYKSEVYTQASGSIGGITYSHNRGGLYTRARAIPTNPNSVFQQAIRSAMGNLTSRWNNILTAAQRAAWDYYADQVNLTDKLGDQRNSGGVGMYIRSNVPRIQAALAVVDDGPTNYNVGEYTEPIIGVISSGGGTLSLAFTPADEWANEDGAALLVGISRGVNPSRNYFKGPYRFAGMIEGDAITPPSSPDSLTLPFAVAVDQKVFVKVNISRVDGRYSYTFRGFGVVAA